MSTSSVMELIGRSGSHFTRVTRIFANELGIALEFMPVHDMVSLELADWGGNPALKIPSLRRDGSLLIGTENICRALAEAASPQKRIVWPEQLRSDVTRNAQECVWHAMAAQVQLVMGTGAGKLPSDNIFFAKVRAGMEGALRYVDAHLDEVLRALPDERDISLFEVTLFCLWEHLHFRETVPTAPYSAIAKFAEAFATRASAVATRYRMDVRPL